MDQWQQLSLQTFANLLEDKQVTDPRLIELYQQRRDRVKALAYALVFHAADGPTMSCTINKEKKYRLHINIFQYEGDTDVDIEEFLREIQLPHNTRINANLQLYLPDHIEVLSRVASNDLGFQVEFKAVDRYWEEENVDVYMSQHFPVTSGLSMATTIQSLLRDDNIEIDRFIEGEDITRFMNELVHEILQSPQFPTLP